MLNTNRKFHDLKARWIYYSSVNKNAKEILTDCSLPPTSFASFKFFTSANLNRSEFYFQGWSFSVKYDVTSQCSPNLANCRYRLRHLLWSPQYKLKLWNMSTPSARNISTYIYAMHVYSSQKELNNCVILKNVGRTLRITPAKWNIKAIPGKVFSIMKSSLLQYSGGSDEYYLLQKNFTKQGRACLEMTDSLGSY